MSTSDNYKDGASKSSDDGDGVCEMKDMLTVDNKDNDTSICADRGKEEYCNAACNKNHRSKHKKDCEEYATERAAEMKNYSNNLRHCIVIVRFALNDYRHLRRGGNTRLVVERQYAVDVVMHPSLIIKAI